MSLILNSKKNQIMNYFNEEILNNILNFKAIFKMIGVIFQQTFDCLKINDFSLR
jgi:hypothetical protein